MCSKLSLSVNSCQKDTTLGQDQKRWNNFSCSSLQKEQFGSSLTPIFVRNSFVAIRLCKSLFKNSRTFSTFRDKLVGISPVIIISLVAVF